MVESAKLTIRGSEIRQRLNEISGLEGDALTDEIKTESDALATEYSAVETRRRAALIAEDADREKVGGTIDAELRERITLRGRARFGNYLLAAARGALPNGAEAELSAAAGIAAGTGHGSIPLDLWEPGTVEAVEARGRGDGLEQRAITPSPATGTGTHVTPIQPAIFDPSIMAMLRVDLPSAETGAYSEMVITTPPSAGARAKSAQFVATAGVLTAVTATPRRISAALETTLEDAATVGTPSFEASLKAATSMALSAQLDEQGVNGDNVAPNVQGLADHARCEIPGRGHGVRAGQQGLPGHRDQLGRRERGELSHGPRRRIHGGGAAQGDRGQDRGRDRRVDGAPRLACCVFARVGVGQHR